MWVTMLGKPQKTEFLNIVNHIMSWVLTLYIHMIAQKVCQYVRYSAFFPIDNAWLFRQKISIRPSPVILVIFFFILDTNIESPCPEQYRAATQKLRSLQPRYAPCEYLEPINVSKYPQGAKILQIHCVPTSDINKHIYVNSCWQSDGLCWRAMWGSIPQPPAKILHMCMQ